MEAETGKICQITAVFPLAVEVTRSSQAVRTVRYDCHTTDRFLNARGEVTQGSTVTFKRSKETLLSLYDTEYPFIVTNDAA